jgi:hypothetical protein
MSNYNPLLHTFALSIMLLISACSLQAQKDISDDFDVLKSPGYGVVVGSVSSIPDYRWQEMSQYLYRSLSDEKIHGVITSAADNNPYTFFAHVPKCEDDGLEAECGRLFAISLPVGDYEIDRVIVSYDEFKHRWEGRNRLGFLFTVKSGQVSYIGNLKSNIQIANDIVAADGMVMDQYERDIPLLRIRFPVLVNLQIDHSLIRGDSWEWRRSNKGKDDVTFH